MAENLTVSKVIPAPARRVYEAWLDAEEHALMTGAATSAGKGGAYTAWDGYIEGRTVSSEPYTRIVQTWRASDFPEGHPDSTLTIEFTEVAGGTEVTLRHEGLPDGMAGDFERGWQDHYFAPMGKYFSSPREKLKEGAEALEEAAEKAGVALEGAVDKAGAALEKAGREVTKALDSARREARKRAVKAVKQGRQVGRRVQQQAKDFGKKVRTLVKAPSKAGAAKKSVVKKAAPAKKPAAKKVAPAKKPAAKKAAPAKKGARAGARRKG
ncbi:MAG: SRPBCC domain-containing protein [Myxococcaceae bacterium]|nr:SRPBCC domain-containing protein [Myxococcaceae bacterium]